MTEIEVGGQLYRIGKLDAFKQFHVARRLAPIQLAMGLSAGEMMAKGAEANETAMLGAIMGPIAEIVAKMPEDDVNYILRTCLAVCTRSQGENKWARVMVDANLMFADIDMTHMMRLTIEVVKENLGGFFGMLPGAPL